MAYQAFIDREAIVKEVKELMAKKELISQVQLSEKFNCSRASFYNIMKFYNIDVASYNKEIKEDKRKESIENIENIISGGQKSRSTKYNFKIDSQFINSHKDNTEDINISKFIENNNTNEIIEFTSNSDSFVVAGLISDRHTSIDENTRQYIYKGPVKSEFVHNYSILYDIANEFVKEKVVEKGYDKLKVYVTGLTQCVGAVVRACVDNNVSLILMHYDNSTNRYNEQLVLGTDDGTTNSLLDLFASVKRNYIINLVDHDADYFRSLDKLYMVKISDTTNRLSEDNSIVYIIDNIQKMFEIYSKEVQKAIEDTRSLRVAADSLVFGTNNSEFKFETGFGCFYNQKKN